MLTCTAAAATDPGLLKARSRFERYDTPSGHVYPRIRTFYNEHTQAKRLPPDLPLIVLQHGLGGSVAQFAPLLNALTQIAPCLAIDLPGCGLSDFKPDQIEAYTTTAFAELLYVAIDRYRNKETKQKVVLIGVSVAARSHTFSPMSHWDKACENDKLIDRHVGRRSRCERSLLTFYLLLLAQHGLLHHRFARFFELPSTTSLLRCHPFTDCNMSALENHVGP
jgi:hypothetical protein